MVHISFVDKGTDDLILKSMPTENISEELIKAMGKEGLVQKEVSVKGKDGKTYTRKQWVRASDAQKEPSGSDSSGSKGSGELDDKTKSKIEGMSVENLKQRKSMIEQTIKYDGDKVAKDPDDPTKQRADGKTVKEIYTPLLNQLTKTLEEKTGGSSKPKESKKAKSSIPKFTEKNVEEISLKEFLSDADEDDISEACKEAELSDGVIVSSDTTDNLDDIENFVKNSKKIKSFGDGTAVYENDGQKFVYHTENGIEALYMSKDALK